MGEFAPLHWVLVAIIALVLFGPKKLPELGKGLGQAIRGFKHEMHKITEDDEPPPPPAA